MIKEVKDYIDPICKKYPQIARSDIVRILNYGWRMFYYYNLRNCDVVVSYPGLWMYSGKLMIDSTKYYEYYRRKMCKKLRVLYRKKRTEWNGYYYTGINEEELKKVQKRKNCVLKLKNKYAFKIKDEASLFYNRCKAIIGFKPLIETTYDFYKENLVCRNITVEEIREHPLTFKEMTLQGKKYELI